MQSAITSCTFRAGPKKADGLFAYQKVDWCDFLDLFVIFSQLRVLSEVIGVYRKAIFCFKGCNFQKCVPNAKISSELDGYASIIDFKTNFWLRETVIRPQDLDSSCGALIRLASPWKMTENLPQIRSIFCHSPNGSMGPVLVKGATDMPPGALPVGVWPGCPPPRDRH